MRFLPDTNIFIALTRRGDRRVARHFEMLEDEIGLSTAVVYELAYGAGVSNRQAFHLATLDEFPFPRLGFSDEDARAAARIRADMKRLGTPIGVYDVLIAGQALARGLTLVTNNTGEFARVDGLRLEDWTGA